MKILISSAFCVLLAATAFGQGTVQFQNTATSRFYFYDYPTATNAVTSAPMNTQDNADDPGYGGPGVLDVGLFWSTSAFNTVTGGTLAGIENISSTAGILNGNVVFPIAGTAPGESIFVQIFAWDGSYGDSAAGLENCINFGGYFGAASAGANTDGFYGLIGSAYSVTLGSTGLPGTAIFSAGTGSFGETVLIGANPYVPEPGTIVLGSLGAAALLCFRRRK